MSSFKVIQHLIEELQSSATQEDDFYSDEKTRIELLGAAQGLVAALTRPDEAVASITHGAGRHMCLQVANDLGLFDLISAKSHSAREMASITGADEKLIVRIMRMMAAVGFVEQSGDRVYSATPMTKLMTLLSVKAGVEHTLEGLDILQSTPEYLKKNGYHLPRTMTETPFQFARKTELDNHKYYAEVRPETMKTFQTFMDGLYGGPARAPWWTWYPIEEVLSVDSEVAFVDVAGGNGHQTAGLLRAFPGTKGRLIVQDLPEVIQGIKVLDPRIERLPYDFLIPQPEAVKGARVFFLSNILHDHPDDVCHNILGNIRAAVTPGHSKILISDMIVPEIDPPIRQLDSDITMFFLSGGAERSPFEWTELIRTAGLKVSKFWYPPGDQNGIIEVEIA
ncbi:hypothetical protein LTR35_010077 [Friedmanniomyces endolithicus]|nr:hypothetical protein LTR35_010077 [Friedmanniomyces endolithicus]KAK0298295.1 hypothetical protein LTS00_003260 [Friedmanniomyces endolithicus]